MDMSPVSQAQREGTPVTVITHPQGGCVARVGNGTAAGYYLIAGASAACQAEFNENQCRHLFK